MDPVAHTLFGAALATSDLGRRSRYATATLLIGANLPDIDVVAGLWGDDADLLFRRGLTHGILAMLVLPPLLTGAICAWHCWRASGSGPGIAGAEAAPLRPRAILALAFLAVLSHPLLDWLNTYGVRLLMPFDARWFYGDALFIIDPWFWLLTAVGVLLARSASRGAIVGWAVLGLLASALILGTVMVPTGAKLAWCVGVAVLVVLRWRRPAWAQSQHVARAGLAMLILHVGAAYGLARMAESDLSRTYPGAQKVQANPMPATPFSHRVVMVEDDLYRIVTPEGGIHELPRRQPDAIVQSALAAPSIRGLANWLRFPAWTVEETPDHWLVRIQDLRYQGPGVSGGRAFGTAEVAVPKSGAAAVAQGNAAQRIATQ